MASSNRQSNCDKQAELLCEGLKDLDKTDPYYPMWIRLTLFLSSLCETINGLQVVVNGDGNGNAGLADRMTELEGLMKKTQSDSREALNTIRFVYGMDRDSMPEYDQENHPGRRKNDKDKTSFDRLIAYVTDKILPPLIVTGILAFIAYQIALRDLLIVARTP